MARRRYRPLWRRPLALEWPGRSGKPQDHMAKHVVATVSEIKPGGRKLVDVKGRAIVLFNLGGEFFALSNRCPHQGGSLGEGILTCLVESSEPGEYRTSRHG